LSGTCHLSHQHLQHNLIVYMLTKWMNKVNNERPILRKILKSGFQMQTCNILMTLDLEISMLLTSCKFKEFFLVPPETTAVHRQGYLFWFHSLIYVNCDTQWGKQKEIQLAGSDAHYRATPPWLMQKSLGNAERDSVFFPCKHTLLYCKKQSAHLFS
jgi:hypothetical protein